MRKIFKAEFIGFRSCFDRLFSLGAIYDVRTSQFDINGCPLFYEVKDGAGRTWVFDNEDLLVIFEIIG